MSPLISVAVLYAERVLGDALSAALIEARFDVRSLGWREPEVQLAEQGADVVVLEAEPGMESAHAVRHILDASPTSKVIIVGLSDAEPALLACFEAGARAHIGSDRSLADLIDGIRAVARGETVCSPATTFALFKRLKHRARERDVSGEEGLTARELTVVSLVASGMSNRAIATKLNVSRHTVKNHIHHILEKLRVPSRADAVRFAISRGLIREQPHS